MRPAPLFVRLGRCGASGGPDTRRLAPTATAAAARTPAAASRTAAAAASAAATASQPRRFFLALGPLGRGIRSGSTANGRPTAGHPLRRPLIAVSPRLSGPDVLEDASGPSGTLLSATDMSGPGATATLEDVGGDAPTTFYVGVEKGPMRLRDGREGINRRRVGLIVRRRCRARREDPL